MIRIGDLRSTKTGELFMVIGKRRFFNDVVRVAWFDPSGMLIDFAGDKYVRNATLLSSGDGERLELFDHEGKRFYA